MQHTVNQPGFSRFSFFFKLIITAVLILQGCGGGSGGGGDSDTSGPETQTVKTIGSQGGAVTVSEVSSPIYGTRIDIPANALGRDTEISVGEAEIPANLPEQYESKGPAVNFGPSGIIFDNEITITLPYNNSTDGQLTEGTLKPAFYDSATGSVVIHDVIETDSQRQTVSFKTEHFSTYLVLIDKEDPQSPPEDSGLIEGQYFTGNPLLDSDGNIIPRGCINKEDVRCGNPWYLSVFHDTFNAMGLVAKVNVKPTDTIGPSDDGPTVAEIQPEDFMSAEIDALNLFENVKESGSVKLWDWQCEFEQDHTSLENYEVVSDDANQLATPEDERIYARIEPVDDQYIRITWGINAQEEIKISQKIVVVFEAVYAPEATGN